MPALLTLAAVLLLAGIAVAFVCGILIGRTGRDALRLELANLKGKHETLLGCYADVRRIAGEAVEAAKQKHFPVEAEVAALIPFSCRDCGFETQSRTLYIKCPQCSVARSMPDYVAPVERWCPECDVSVRSESWPMECPACHTVFGFDES